ncbi:MAG: hypothetical protein B7X06_03390, partial [Verrucomicrobia bacterium 21-51-4]
DSRAVRLIVRKALKPFECELFDAANGEEGLQMAAQHHPDLILLDVTMPIMDGVEMLMKLKADPKLKNIYVMMLTAEAGRDVVVKIAKMGVRDYIVKPFHEADLVEKIKQILDLSPASDSHNEASVSKKVKTLQDPCTVLLVVPKAEFAEPLRNQFAKFPWRFEVVTNIEQAHLWLKSNRPDSIVVDLTMQQGAGLDFVHTIKADPVMGTIALIALTSKDTLADHQHALESSTVSVAARPVDLADMELKLLQAMHIDATGRFFAMQEHALIVNIPVGLPSVQVQSIADRLWDRISSAVGSGADRMVFNIEELDTLSADLIRLINAGRKSCDELKIPCSILAKPQLERQCRSYIESKGWSISTSLEASMGNN